MEKQRDVIQYIIGDQKKPRNHLTGEIMIKKQIWLMLALTLSLSVNGFAGEDEEGENKGTEISQVDNGCKKCKPR